MNKNQRDLFGDQVPIKKVRQSEREVLNKHVEKQFSRSETTDFLRVIGKQLDPLKWPVETLLSKLSLMERKNGGVKRKKIITQFQNSLKILQDIRKNEDSRRRFGKIQHRFYGLYGYFFNDHFNPIIQFYCILTILHIFVKMEDAIEYGAIEENNYAMDKSGYIPHDSQELRRLISRMEEIVLSDFTMRIIYGKIEISSGYYSYKSKLPLKLDDSIPEEIKNHYSPPRTYKTE